MSIFDRIFGGRPEQKEIRIEPAISFDTVEKDGANPFPMQTNISQPYSLLGGMGSLYQGFGQSDTGEQVSHISALQHSAVYACIRCITSDLARLPLQLLQHLDPGTKLLRKHPIARLLKEPNPWQHNFDFLAYMITSMQLRGNAFCWIRRDIAGRPMELVPLHPDRVTVMWNRELYGRLIYRFTSSVYNSQEFVVDQEDMLHLKNSMSLDDGGAVGVSPIQIGQNVIALALANNKCMAKVFKQGAMLKGVILMPPNLKTSPETLQAAMESWSQANSGVENTAKTAFLPDGITYQPISMSAVDAQMLEARNASVADIARLWKVPLHKIGNMDASTNNNIESEAQSYIDNTLIPIAVSIEQEFHRKLLFESEREDLQFRFNFDEMLRGNRKDRIAANQMEFLCGTLNQNEWRLGEGRNSMGPEGDIFHIPLNIDPNQNPSVTTQEQPEAPSPTANVDDDDSTNNT